jgi:hypothetical protein
MSDILMSCFAMFFFQDPSLLQFQRRLEKKKQRNNLRSMFGVAKVPCDSQIRGRTDEVDYKRVRVLLPQEFERVRRAGYLAEYRSTITSGANKGEYYVSALDGTDYFHSTRISCPQCLHFEDKSGVEHYRHIAVGATVIKAGSHRILPLDAEMCGPQDGRKKQDCESNAAKRLIRRIRSEHPHLALIMTGDDLYSHVPFVKECEELRLRFVLVAKPESHKELFEWVEDLESLKENERCNWSVGPACSRKFYEARIVRSVPLREDGEVEVNFFEVWETEKEGRLLYHNSWVTDLDVRKENVSELVGIGRSKWKIENEQFNTQKNHGYHLEHNFGHGEKNLSAVFYYLNLLAFLFHIILERADRLYQQLRGKGLRREEVWNNIRTLVDYAVWTSWTNLMEFMLSEEAPLPP